MSTTKPCMKRWLLLVTAIGTAPLADAYIGPGAGLSLVAAFWGLLLSVLAAVGFLLMWPIRKAIRQRQQDEQEVTSEGVPPSPQRVNGDDREQ